MSPAAYYNEVDPFKAEWLRQLIAAGHIAPGDVDERSIADVEPAELVGYTQCHFFAGIGVWSHALRLAGWPDERPVWTGSCPCPSFSAAGKGEGFADPRHLWPQWYRLIRERHPASVLGEQVAAAIGHGWLDLVCGDMEAEGYAIAAAVLGAHSAGAPHIRQRLYFGAHASSGASERESRSLSGAQAQSGSERLTDGHCAVGYSDGRATGQLAHAELNGGRADFAQRGAQGRTADGRDRATGDGSDTAQRGQPVCGSASGSAGHAARAGEPECGTDAKRVGCGEGSTPQPGCESRNALTCDGSKPCIGHQPIGPRLEGHFGDVREWRGPGWLDPLTARSVAAAGATRGFWADCDWWYGRDGKYRPIGPGLQPLAHGATARVGRLRGYGDAINAETAKEFIAAALEALV